MLIGLVVGVAISLFQALTQMLELTLLFVPRDPGDIIAMLIALPFMADRPDRRRLSGAVRRGAGAACDGRSRSGNPIRALQGRRRGDRPCHAAAAVNQESVIRVQ
jgi:Bacterial export proteins, family 3